MLERQGSYNVGVINGSLWLNPSYEVSGTLVAACTAKTEKEDIVTELCTDVSLRSAPIVCGDKASLLKNLGGTSNVCNNTGELFSLVKYVKKLNAGVVSALKGYEVCGVGVTPHL